MFETARRRREGHRHLRPGRLNDAAPAAQERRRALQHTLGATALEQGVRTIAVGQLPDDDHDVGGFGVDGVVDAARVLPILANWDSGASARVSRST